MIDGERFVLKHLHVDDDWTMRGFGDLCCRPVRLWTTGLLDALPATVDHAVVGAATGLGRNGWGAALLMHDVGAHLVPEGDDPIALDQHRQMLDHLAELSSAFWGWEDDLDLLPLENRYSVLNGSWLAAEARQTPPAFVPTLAADGWERFAERAPGAVAAVIADLRRDVDPLVRAVRTTPSTFLHGDWKMGNLGTRPDGRSVLLDWTYPGAGPPLHELAWYLALNRSRLPESKEAAIDALRSSFERRGIDTARWWEPPARPVPPRGARAVRVGEGARRRGGAPLVVRAGPRRGPMAGVTVPDGRGAATGLGDAYSQTGAAWASGPARVYDRLAEVLVDRAPMALAGRRVLDLGAGTGAVSRAVHRAGGRALACDLAFGMLATDRGDRPPATVADARILPLASGSLDGVVASFSLNHLPDPEVALVEAARVVAPGGFVLASAYAADDDHPVKAAVAAAATEQGWSGESWYEELRTSSLPILATPDGAAAVARLAGLHRTDVTAVEVPFPDLDAGDLVAWRLGLAQLAPFIDAGGPALRARVEARALELLGPPPLLVRRMVVLRVLV